MHALYTRYTCVMCTRYTRGAVRTRGRPDLTLQRPLFVPIFFCAVPCAFYAVAAAAGGGSIDLARLQDDGYVACCMLHVACCIAQLSARQDKKRRACATVRIAFMALFAPAAHAALALVKEPPHRPDCHHVRRLRQAVLRCSFYLLQLAAAAAAAGALLSHLDQL